MPELVTVVVPTRNSAATLEACLRSVRAQTHQAVELVVVDNGSDDDTKRIAGRHADAVLDAGPERSAQRNAGARHGRGASVFFVDSDMVLEPEVVREAVARVSEGAGAVVVPESSFGEGFWARVKAFERDFYVGDDTVEAARFFRRDVFDAAGGYDEAIVAGPEDWDMHERAKALGRPLARTQAMIHHDEGRLRLRETVATKYYYGKSTATYLRRHPAQARKQLTVLRPAFLRQPRRLLDSPRLAAAMLLMKTLELSSGAAGLASARLRRG